MKWFIWMFVTSAGLSYYLTKIDQRSDMALMLIEFETHNKLKVWWISLFLAAICAVLKRKKSLPYVKLEQQPRDELLGNAGTQDLPEKKWKEPEGINHDKRIRNAIDSLSLPKGAKIVFSPDERYPIRLTLERCTPEAIRSALRIFANHINQHPTPPAVQVQFVDVIDTGIPYNTQVLGALRTHYSIEEMMVRCVNHEVEVRFLCPDDFWIKRK